MLTETTPALFAQETATYNARKAELLRTDPGKYVVIKGTDIFGIFDDESYAYAQALRHFGLHTAFLLKQIAEAEEVYVIGGSLL